MKRNDIAVAHSEVEQTVLASLRDVHREFLFAGTYNGWNPQALPVHTLSGKEWSAEIELIPAAYQYKLLMNGRWCCKAV